MKDLELTNLKSTIETTLNAKNASGDYLMNKSRCWISIYKVLIDHKIIITDGDFTGFEKFIYSLFGNKPPRLPVDGKDLRRLYRKNDMFSLPIDQWRITPCNYSVSVKLKYCDVGEYFERRLSGLAGIVGDEAV